LTETGNALIAKRLIHFVFFYALSIYANNEEMYYEDLLRKFFVLDKYLIFSK